MCFFTTATRTAVINWYFFPFIFSVFKMRMSKFFFQLVIVIHVFACAWYCLACPLNECYREENWVKHQGNSFQQLQDKLDSSTWILLNFSFILGRKSILFSFGDCIARGWLASVLDRMKIADIPDSILPSFFSKYKRNRFFFFLIQMNTTTALIGAMLFPYCRSAGRARPHPLLYSGLLGRGNDDFYWVWRYSWR